MPKSLSSHVVLAAVAALAGLSGAAFAPQAQAQFATGGTGLYRPQIFWVDFGASGSAIASGATVTRGFNVGTPASAANRLDVTCSVSNFATTRGTGGLFVYTPGTWQGDGLDNLYNIGGSQNGTGANPNTLDNGVRVNNGSTQEFDFTCSATLGGAPFTLGGLVFADAEASGGAEYVGARLTGGGTVRVIDQISQCGTSSTVTVTGTPAEVRFGAPTAPAVSCENNATPAIRGGPALVGYIDGATSGRVGVYGGGISAVALGALITLEFSESIPASYGVAVHVLNNVFNGGAATAGVNYNNPANLATFAYGPHLGPTVLADADAAGAVGGSDVDALPKVAGPAGAGYANVAPPRNVPGSTYTIPNVACVGPGSIAGWIDFNGNGTFDVGERSAVATCPAGTGSVILSWTIPAAGFVSQATSYLRLRMADSASGLVSASGSTPNGEAEDYRFVLQSDYGDAPDAAAGTAAGNYSTRAADGGPSHSVAASPTVYLGSAVPDGDDGTLQNAAASADDASGSDDEDGVTGFPTAAVRGQSTNLSVAVTGSGSLNAWVDWNHDGDFVDAGEQIATSVARTTGTAPLALAVPATAVSGITYARFRYGTTAAPTSVGADGIGEIEDYSFTVAASADLQVTKTNTPLAGVNDQAADTVASGATVTYSIVVTNNGVDAADNAMVRDPVPTGLTCTTATCGTTVNGAVCPALTGAALLSALQSTGGVAVPTLPNTGALTFSVTCTVN